MGLRERSYLTEGTLSPGRVNVDSPVYTKKERVPKFNVPISPLSGHVDAGAMLLRKRLLGWSREDHRKTLASLRKAFEATEKKYEQELDLAAQETWGRKFQVTDYYISCIGSDQFSDKRKKALRALCRERDTLGGAIGSHQYLVRHWKRYKR